MTAPHGRGLLHLAAALDQQAAFDAASYVGRRSSRSAAGSTS